VIAGQANADRCLGLFLAGRTADDLAGFDRDDLPDKSSFGIRRLVLYNI